MAKIAVFDSGLGSLSIIKELQKHTKCEIIYFADRQNFPYGERSAPELKKIINHTIRIIKERFEPDFIVMGSNTPSVVLDIKSTKIFKVLPPIRQAAKISKTKNIAILATRSTVQSKGLYTYIAKNKTRANIYKIDCSRLVNLVESGDFLNKPYKTKRVMYSTLADTFDNKRIDVATLSSTHLPFLKKYLKKQFPGIRFLDPAEQIASDISGKIKSVKRNRLKIYSTGDNSALFANNLKKMGIKNKITFL